MKRILLLTALLGLAACKQEDLMTEKSSQNETSQDWQVEQKSTSVEGQIFFTMSEVVEGEEPEWMDESVADYKLDYLRVYFMGQKRSYKVYPDYEGTFGLDEIEPGSYQIVVKSSEKFEDSKGVYTYQGIMNVRIKKDERNVLNQIHVRKIYLTQEESEIIDELKRDSPAEDLPTIQEEQ